ncbi:transposase, partial [Streptomyces sp. NPDC046197]|uniref:transposase n=1 Tax=Streptomyces sp. NPDC046197 TaxID=3154337 RepID=UPI0033EEC9CB
SDFETVQELRCDLRWKAACGLGLHDMAFDPSLLAYFRRRLTTLGAIGLGVLMDTWGLREILRP